MSANPKIWAPLAVALIACGNLCDAQAASFGSIRGIVKDATGGPLAGAAVLVVADLDRTSAESQQPERVIKRATTDGTGGFIATGITPGKYRVKALAPGFTTVELAAQVKPNKVTIFDSILLRRIGTLSEEAKIHPDSKYAARSVRRTVFHHQETQDPNGEPETIVLADQANRETHGFVFAYGEVNPKSALGSGTLFGSDFAVSQRVGDLAQMVISGQVGSGENAPQRLQALTTTTAGDRHKVAIALGYGRFTIARRTNPKTLAQFSLSATDTWQVSGPILVVYGLEVARFAEDVSGTSVLPRFGVSVEAGAQTRLFGGLTPGSSTDNVSGVDLESGEIVFARPRPVLIRRGTGPVADRSFRLEFGGERRLSDESSVEMMAFVDTISGHGVGVLAIPSNSPISEKAFGTHELSGRSRGVRVVYHRRLTNEIDGAIGYAFGQGQQLGESELTDPASLFRDANFQVISAKIDANFVGTGTKISTVLRFAPSRAVFAIDPFQGQISTYDPNLSFLLTQELPSFGMVPGHLEAILDVRNLLDQQTSVADDRQELIASRYHRLVRVGLSLRF